MSSMESPIPNRPMRFGEMLIATFRYLAKHPSATLGLGALLATVTSSVTGVIVNGFLLGNDHGGALTAALVGDTITAAQAERAAQTLGSAAGYLALGALVSLVVQLIAMGVMTTGMVRALRGEPVEPAALWGAVPWRGVIAINAYTALVLVAVLGVAAGLAVVTGSVTVAITAFAVASPVMLAIAVISTLAVPAAVLDALPARAALRRAAGLSSRSLLRTTGIVIGSLVFWDAIGNLAASPVAAIAGGLAGSPASATGTALQTLITGIVSGAITFPATAAMAVLLYVDLVRRSMPTDGQTTTDVTE